MNKIINVLRFFKSKNIKLKDNNELKNDNEFRDLIGISGRIYDYHLYKAENGFIRDRATNKIMEIQWY